MPETFTVAVLSDIHGNDVALEAVLADLAGRPHDAVVVAGDLVSHGPRPREAFARLRALAAPTVYGNTDRYVLGHGVPSSVASLFDWARQRIGDEGTAWLASLPFRHPVTPPEGASPEDDLLVVHATPTDVDAFLSLEADPSGAWDVTPEAEAATMVGDARASLILFGHIHRATAGTVRGRRLASAGSVGFPSDGDPRAAYALVTWRGDGWQVAHRRVAYDHAGVAKELVQAGVPFADVLVRRLVGACYVPLG